MATGQTLLNLMELVNQELQLQPAEADVTRGLIALNAAQDYLESRLSEFPNLLGDTTGTVTTTGGVETTAFPAGVLRIDRLQYINPENGYPSWDLRPVRRTGGHSYRRFWPWNIIVTPAPGKPMGYYTDGRSIYWSPLPQGTDTVRWYGFQVKEDITAGSTIEYPEICHLPMSVYAARLMKIGVGDSATDLVGLAQETFGPAIKTLSNFVRDGASGLEYSYIQDT